MTLEKNGTYFYVGKSLYDSLVILKNNYEFERVGELIGVENNLETIEWLREELPSPLDIIAPFLRLVNKEIGDDLELCTGVLHEIFCTGLDPYGFLRTPADMRRGIEFGRTVGSLYQEMWKGMLTHFRDYDLVMEALSNPYPATNRYQNDYSLANINTGRVVDEEEHEVEETETIGGFSIGADGSLLFEDEESDEVEPLTFGSIIPTGATSSSEVVNNDDSDEDPELKALKSLLSDGGAV